MSPFWLIIGFMFLGNIGWWIWADRRLRSLPVAGLWRTLLAGFIGIQLGYLVFFFAVPSVARRAHHFVPEESLGVFYLWCLIVMPIAVVVTLLLTAGRRLIFGRRQGTPALAPVSSAEPTAASARDDQPTPALSRRQLLSAAAVAIPPLVAGVGVAYGQHAIRDLRVRRMDVPIAGLPENLEGLTIAHLTDIHVGKFVDQRYLRQVSDLTNSLRADLHLLTGDLIDLSLSDLPGALDFVTSLDPRHGVLMCEGNHDLIEDGRSFYNGVTAKGIPLLVNDSQAVRIPGRSTVRVLGMRWGGHNSVGPGLLHRKDEPRRLIAEQFAGEFPILLAHHPHAFDAAAEAGIPLTLAGHTHGGLLMLSERVGPAAVLYKYWSGLYRKGGANLFVSNGVGSWYPIRIKAQPEVALLTLRSAPAGA